MFVYKYDITHFNINETFGIECEYYVERVLDYKFVESEQRHYIWVQHSEMPRKHILKLKKVFTGQSCNVTSSEQRNSEYLGTTIENRTGIVTHLFKLN